MSPYATMSSNATMSPNSSMSPNTTMSPHTTMSQNGTVCLKTLVHPFVLHAASGGVLFRPRTIYDSLVNCAFAGVGGRQLTRTEQKEPGKEESSHDMTVASIRAELTRFGRSDDGCVEKCELWGRLLRVRRLSAETSVDIDTMSIGGMKLELYTHHGTCTSHVKRQPVHRLLQRARAKLFQEQPLLAGAVAAQLCNDNDAIAAQESSKKNKTDQRAGWATSQKPALDSSSNIPRIFFSYSGGGGIDGKCIPSPLPTPLVHRLPCRFG